jgi:O-antigen/teichoic acid export membrane protein
MAICLKILISEIWPSKNYTAIKSDTSISFWKYSFSALLTNTFLIFVISQDIFIVRYYFSETTSGIYSSASIIGKIILYAVSPITIYLFPLYIKYRNDIQKLKYMLYTSTLAIIAVTTIASIIYKLYSDAIINLLLGTKFSESAKILPVYAVFISIYSVLFHVCQFFLSRKSSLSYKIPISIFLTQSLLLYLFHQNSKQVILMSTISMPLGVISLSLLTLLRQLYHRVLGRFVSRRFL